MPITATPHANCPRANIPQHLDQSLNLKPSLMTSLSVLVQTKKATILTRVEATKADLTLGAAMTVKKVSLVEVSQQFLTMYDVRRRLG